MNCPSCSQQMTAMTVDGHQGKPVAIDLCLPCQAFWFDKYESLQLAPASTLRLLEMIGDQHSSGPTSFSNSMRCPRCSNHLRPTQDMMRATKFNYFRCTAGHGRFIRFFEFLREKDFLRPLSKKQIAELQLHLKTVNCSNCGAPVDVVEGAVCDHCASPLSMLDMEQPERLIAQLKEAAAPKPVDPTLPFQLLREKRHMEILFGKVESDPLWLKDVVSTDLVHACLGSVARWLKG